MVTPRELGVKKADSVSWLQPSKLSDSKWALPADLENSNMDELPKNSQRSKESDTICGRVLINLTELSN
jgi:hypothetical protein